MCNNHSAVLDTGRNQGNDATLGCSDPAAVDYRTARCAIDIEVEIASHEILIPYINRGRHQTADVHNGRFAEQDTVGIDQHDSPVSGQLTENVGWGVTIDTVECYRIGVGLQKTNQLVPINRKRTPVDDYLVGTLDDLEKLRIHLHDIGVPCNHTAVFRPGMHLLGMGTDQNRAEQQRQHQIAKCQQ